MSIFFISNDGCVEFPKKYWSKSSTIVNMVDDMGLDDPKLQSDFSASFMEKLLFLLEKIEQHEEVDSLTRVYLKNLQNPSFHESSNQELSLDAREFIRPQWIEMIFQEWLEKNNRTALHLMSVAEFFNFEPIQKICAHFVSDQIETICGRIDNCSTNEKILEVVHELNHFLEIDNDFSHEELLGRISTNRPFINFNFDK